MIVVLPAPPGLAPTSHEEPSATRARSHAHCSRDSVRASRRSSTESILPPRWLERVTIEIYSIAGKLISRMQKNDAFGRYNWDAQSDDNRDVASGMYLVIIKSGTGERVIKKVMIIR